jgi:hypothetical protein
MTCSLATNHNLNLFYSYFFWLLIVGLDGRPHTRYPFLRHRNMTFHPHPLSASAIYPSAPAIVARFNICVYRWAGNAVHYPSLHYPPFGSVKGYYFS